MEPESCVLMNEEMTENSVVYATNTSDGLCYDVVIIGGGILGCFAARNLMRWHISAVLIEAEDDVCKGITRSNSAIVYTGYDNKPGSLKAAFTVQGNRNFDKLCEELDVPFSRCGSLLVAFDSKAENVLHKKYHDGIRNGVTGLKLLNGAEVLDVEPMLSANVKAGLYAPDTGTVNPWQLGIAACENAMANGCDVWCNETVSNIVRSENGYWITTSNKKVHAKAIINCAGLSADQVQNLLYPAEVSLNFDGADYLVMDKAIAKPKHVIFHETAEGKGITAVPCTEGNLLLESTARALTVPFASTLEGIQSLKDTVKAVLPQVDTTKVIRSFGAVRPNLQGRNGENISDFYIGNPAPDFYSFIGVKTPGLTCADELGRYVAEKIAAYLDAERNKEFSPIRKGIAKTDGQIICQCEQITKGEIIEAIKRGATTVDGIKRRVGTGMGRCQGSRCAYAIERLLEEEIHGENVHRANGTI